MLRGELVIRYPDGALPDVDGALAEVDGVDRRAILDLAWGRDGALTQLYHVAGGNTEGIERSFAAHDCVHDWEIAVGDDDDCYVLVHGRSDEVVRPLYAFVEDQPILIQPPIHCLEASWRFGVLGTDEAIQRAHDVAREHADVDVQGLHRHAPDRPRGLHGLTDRQREALRTAADIGFYDGARRGSFAELAAALDCSESAAHALLRRAEAALIEGVVGE